MTQGFGYSGADIFQSVFTYSASQQVVQAVDSAPGWIVVGGFTVESNVDAVLQITGLVSEPSLLMQARVFLLDGENSGQVGGLVQIATIEPSTKNAAQAVSLQANKLYQVQVQTVGGSDETDFGILHSLQMVI